MDRLYLLIENPGTEVQSISSFTDFRSVISEVRRKIETYMINNKFPEDKVADAVIATKEGLINLIHRNPKYEPFFALIEFKISNESIELAIEDRERGKIRKIKCHCLSECGRGYKIMESLANVKIQANEDGFHRVILRLHR